jgi:hypothetical protein
MRLLHHLLRALQDCYKLMVSLDVVFLIHHTTAMEHVTLTLSTIQLHATLMGETVAKRLAT